MFDSRLPHQAELALWREHLLDRQDQAGSIPALRTHMSVWRNGRRSGLRNRAGRREGSTPSMDTMSPWRNWHT